MGCQRQGESLCDPARADDAGPMEAEIGHGYRCNA